MCKQPGYLVFKRYGLFKSTESSPVQSAFPDRCGCSKQTDSNLLPKPEHTHKGTAKTLIYKLWNKFISRNTQYMYDEINAFNYTVTGTCNMLISKLLNFTVQYITIIDTLIASYKDNKIRSRLSVLFVSTYALYGISVWIYG